MNPFLQGAVTTAGLIAAALTFWMLVSWALLSTHC